MNEDVGTLADINAAAAGWGWPPFLSPWGKFGTDYARRVSDDLIEQIKQGVAPWQQPWPPGERVAPENFSSGKKYTGGNSVYLMSRSIQQGFGGDNCWGTYRQIEARRRSRPQRRERHAGLVLDAAEGAAHDPAVHGF